MNATERVMRYENGVHPLCRRTAMSTYRYIDSCRYSGLSIYRYDPVCRRTDISTGVDIGTTRYVETAVCRYIGTTRYVDNLYKFVDITVQKMSIHRVQIRTDVSTFFCTVISTYQYKFVPVYRQHIDDNKSLIYLSKYRHNLKEPSY